MHPFLCVYGVCIYAYVMCVAYVYVHGYTCVCMHVETRVSCLGILFHHSPPYVLRHTVSLESRTC